LQSFPDELLNLKDWIIDLFQYLKQLLNIVIIVWIVIVFFTWRYVSKSSLLGFFIALIQSYCVFGIEEAIFFCDDVKGILLLFCLFNVGALLALFLAGGSLLSFTFDTFNIIRDTFFYLLLNCISFALLNKSYDLEGFNLNEYFSWENLVKAIFPVSICSL
jgi:hypothetical protein